MKSLLCAFALLAFATNFAAAAEPQLAHMVFFTLASDTPENQQKLIDGAEKYLSNHEGVVYFSVGALAKDLDREVNDKGFQVALHIVFVNKAAYEKYAPHPRHNKFIEENKALWSKVRVFDSYVKTAK
ncbi:Stress responsive A/B Barrel Domain protein [Anatilimnocola aggregata]|uniref:Stress responsive A/B Barrel Domain protein n=1 Tax=Anatilimnocola aggregata TaxID=2528021 RepID=A0A517YD86_9BACT|nr:Dabb family protein [Anatilimnocola aggregata]QDU28200.1 Stress responsive A/B Barrel Domain protein [Anatilimnocola aggregata]